MGRTQTKRPYNKQKVLDYLMECATKGITPSIREICTALSIKSTSSVHALLLELEDDGKISRNEHSSRMIKITGFPTFTPVPLLGNVAAGLPILAVEQITEYIPISSDFASGRELFALKIKGDSMLNAAIINGDIVICERAITANNGEIIIALVDDEATCKRFYCNDNKIELRAENDAFEPIILTEVDILGKVVANLRFY